MQPPSKWTGAFILAVTSHTTAQEPPATVQGAEPASAYSVALRGYLVHALHVFEVGDGFTRHGETPGTSVCLLLRLLETPERHIVSRAPRVLIQHIIDETGNDLRPHTGVRDGRGNIPLGIPAFVLPVPASGFDRQTSNPRPIPLDTVIYFASLPSAISSVDGVVSFEEVTEDKWIDRPLPDGPATIELAPGISFWTGDPPAAWPAIPPQPYDSYASNYASFQGGRSAGYVFDAENTRTADGDTPVVNFVRLSGAKREPSLLNLHPVTIDGRVVARCDACVPRDPECALSIDAHLVLATRTIQIPFHLEGIPLAGRLAARPGAMRRRSPVARLFASEADRFEVRLVQTSCGGSKDADYQPLNIPLNATFELGVRDLTGTRSISRIARWTVTDILDEHGRPVADAQATTVEHDAGATMTTPSRFYPLPALPTEQLMTPEATKPRVATMARLTAPFTSLPPYLGTLRGYVDVESVVRESIVTVPLKPSAEPLEVAPGVRVAIRAKSPKADSRIPADVPYSEVQITVSHSTPADPRRPARLNLIQPIKPDGTAVPPIWQAHPDPQSDGDSITLSHPLWSLPAAALHLQFVLETRTDRVPFEFHDIPLASP